MKVIDEKGRLFEKINVFDFMVILFLLSLTPMFYFGYTVFNNKVRHLPMPTESSAKKIIEIEEPFVFTQLDAKTAEQISAGDKEINSKGDVIGFMVSFGRSQPLIYEIDVGNGKKLAQEDRLMSEIPVILRLKVELRANTIYYKDKPIQVNSAIEFKSDKYTAKALFVPADSHLWSKKTQNELKDILLPDLERKINNVQAEMNNLKKKVDTIETYLRQKETISAQAQK